MTDFIVVGGGIAGCAVAARLAPLGAVVLLEAEDTLGYHASGRSAALLEENYGSASTVALNRAARSYLTTAGVLSPRGVLMVALPDEVADFEDSAAQLAMPEISTAEALTLVPILQPRIARAAYSPDALDIDTDMLLQGYAKAARGAGAQIVTGARVQAIEPHPNGWAVRTAAGGYEGRILVNAAGAWADHIAQMAGVTPIGITPMRRSMAVTRAPTGVDISNWPMLFGPGETWYAKPQAGKLLVSPADETPTDPHDAWAEDLTLAEGIARYEAHVTQPVTRLESSWAGLRSFAPDRSLVIGFAPQARSFFWCAGQGGYGMQSSPAYSQLTADLIAGRPPEIAAEAVTALSPARFQ